MDWINAVGWHQIDSRSLQLKVLLPESNIADVHDSSLKTASLRQMGIYEEATSTSATGTYRVRQVLKS